MTRAPHAAAIDHLPKVFLACVVATFLTHVFGGCTRQPSTELTDDSAIAPEDAPSESIDGNSDEP
ncbi:MAG: TlpA family protein disulfide reductase, partial [Rhodopirellula bahusiensis]